MSAFYFLKVDVFKSYLFFSLCIYFVYEGIKPIFSYIEKIYSPYLEINEKTLCYKNKKLIIPFSEIIEIEQYIGMVKIRTTTNITNTLRVSLFSKLIDKVSKPNTEYSFKIYNQYTILDDTVDKIILNAYNKYKSNTEKQLTI